MRLLLIRAYTLTYVCLYVCVSFSLSRFVVLFCIHRKQGSVPASIDELVCHAKHKSLEEDRCLVGLRFPYLVDKRIEFFPRPKRDCKNGNYNNNKTRPGG